MCFETIMEIISVPLCIAVAPFIGLYRLLRSVFYEIPYYILQNKKKPQEPEIQLSEIQEPEIQSRPKFDISIYDDPC